MKVRAFWDVVWSRPTFQRRFTGLMLEAVSTCETSVYSETTRCYMPESSNLHTRRRENLKSHKTSAT
jgi:hypothetical protein